MRIFRLHAMVAGSLLLHASGNYLLAHSVLTYRASLNSENVVGAVPVPEAGSSGEVLIQFAPDNISGGPRLTYFVTLAGLDLDGSQTPLDVNDNVTGIRIRIGGPEENGPHTLNIFGQVDGETRQDDLNMISIPSLGEVSGIWSDSDETFTGENGTRLPIDSIAFGDGVDDLLNGRLYVEVATVRNPEGELRGSIEPVPSTVDLKYFNGAGFQFTFNVFSPRLIRIESTGEFADWVPVTSLVVTNYLIRTLDFDAANHSQRFYRITELFLKHPTIIQQPQNQQSALGGTVQFEVVAEGVPEPEFQWYFGTEPIDGATNAVFELQNIELINEGSYSVVISSASGTVTSDTVVLLIVD